MSRAIRIAGSFAIVSVAYWAYALVAVPLIEPPADPRRARQISEAQRQRARDRLAMHARELKGLFPPDAWELDSPKVLESERIKLLMQTYQNLGEGRVELHPCTVIFTPEAPGATQAQRKRQAVILEAPEGAVLEFDKPLDLSRMKIGRLEAGKLIGRITIRSKGKKPGPEDDLFIITRDIQLSERHVRTPHAVDFRLGANYGRGRQMHIKLLSGDNNDNHADGQRSGPDIGGIELFEITHVEQLHLELGDAKSVSAGTGNAAGGRPAGASDLPMEITCRGPFRFDLVRKVATFEDQVDVIRINPTGPSDQLNCELLSVFFTDRRKPGPDGENRTKEGPEEQRLGPLDLKPARIEARGDPVVVSAPSEKAYARGQWLDYDLLANRIVLDGSREVMLREGPNEIRARRLEYQSAGPGRLGRIAAKGPGWLRGQMADRPDQQLHARWKEHLRVRPHEENQLISLTGGASLKFRGMGQLDAREIHLWLLESPPDTKLDRPQLRPDRMLARGDVRVKSPQLSSAVEQLEVWFEPDGSGKIEEGKKRDEEGKQSSGARKQSSGARKQSSGARKQSSGARKQSSGGGRNTASGPFSGRRHGGLQPTAYRLPLAGRPAGQTPDRQQHFDIVGRLLRARMLLEDDQTRLSELTVEDDVRFVETQTKQADQRPLCISGDRLHVLGAQGPHAAATVTGRPAHFEGRGLALTGPNINLNRGTNKLWIDGPGRMDLPLDRDMQGRPTRNAGTLQVHWQDRMTFNGQIARFEESVTAAAPNRYLQTETLEVEMKRPIRFSDDKIQQDPQVEQIRCRGGAFMESRAFEQRKLSSYDRMQAVDLVVNLDSGALKAGGPGWLSSVRRGSDERLTGRGDASAPRTSNNDTVEDPARDQLGGLYVRFQGSITGNVHRREMTFHDQVHAAYAPVDSWRATLTADDPAVLGPRGVVLHCDKLSVGEMATPLENRRALELEAAGNTVAESSIFTARAIRMTYAQAKDLLILEGNGRTDAELFRQQQIGGPRSRVAARKILYWPKTNQFKVIGGRSLELPGLPSRGRL